MRQESAQQKVHRANLMHIMHERRKEAAALKAQVGGHRRGGYKGITKDARDGFQ
jgi:hypothetical protein